MICFEALRRGYIYWVFQCPAVDPGTDQGKSDAVITVFLKYDQRVIIGQAKRVESIRRISEIRTGGMDDRFGIPDAEGFRDDRVSVLKRRLVCLAGLGQFSAACFGEYGSAQAASCDEMLVGRVDDSVYVLIDAGCMDEPYRGHGYNPFC